MKKKKRPIRETLKKLEYPMTFKKFSKTFKKINKKERRFFIKLLKEICDEIKNQERVYYAVTCDLNLNQKGMMILLADRMILVHSKAGSKTIHLNEITYNDIAAVDFDVVNPKENGDDSGILYIKEKREHAGTKNYKIRSVNKAIVPRIVEFIRKHK